MDIMSNKIGIPRFSTPWTYIFMIAEEDVEALDGQQ